MNILDIILIVTTLFVLFGIFILVNIVWKILTHRDELYKQRYDEFLERQERIRRNLKNDRFY